MEEQIDLTMVNWARAQFALTAMYRWIFVPLTLGLSFLIAFYESIYIKTENEEWKKIAKFWMTLFGINFAIGVATGIILKFEFGTNWSNYFTRGWWETSLARLWQWKGSRHFS